MDGVKECHQKDKRLTIVLEKEKGRLEEVFTAISETGTEIMSVDTKEASLENVFLALTGRSLRD